jgi:hypothetical protein
MVAFCIIETVDGLTVGEHPKGETAEQYAHRRGGIVVDPGPYDSYDDALDALTSLQQELADDSASGTPGERALEGRSESKN